MKKEERFYRTKIFCPIKRSLSDTISTFFTPVFTAAYIEHFSITHITMYRFISHYQLFQIIEVIHFLFLYENIVHSHVL